MLLRLWRRAFSSERTLFDEPSTLIALRHAVKSAMIARDRIRVNCIKDVLAQVVNASKTASPVTNDAQILQILQSSVSKRQDSASKFRASKRPDLAQVEERELAVLQSFLPVSKSEVEVQTAVQKVIDRLGAGPKDMGRVLSALTQEIDEASTPRSVQAKIVKRLLDPKR